MLFPPELIRAAGRSLRQHREKLESKAKNLDIEILPSLRFLIDRHARYKVAYSGRGAAKSWSFARAILALGMRRRLRVLCLRATKDSLKNSVHELFKQQISLLGLDGIYEAQAHKIINIQNRTEIVYAGLSDEQAIKSIEGVDICWVEEAEAVSEKAWRALTPTIRKPGAEIWVSFNPVHKEDPVYRRFVEGEPQGGEPWAPPKSSIVVKVCYLDNPWLSAETRDEAEEMRRNNPDLYAHIWLGEVWTRSETQVFNGKWVIEDFVPDENDPRWDGPYYGIDWGFANDPTVIVRLWINGKRLFVEYDEGGPKIELVELGALFDRVPGTRQHTMRADCARPETISHVCNQAPMYDEDGSLIQNGFDVVPCEKWEGCVKDGVFYLTSFEKIVIHSRCHRAIQEARLYSYATNRGGDVLPKILDKNNHVWDAARYALEPLITRSSDVPMDKAL